jgi:hypothetical protein
MSTGFARVGLPGRMIIIVCVTVMVRINCCWVIVIVRGRPVVVIWVIMPDVLVDVQRRRHGRRHDQGLNEREYYEPAHGSSVLRPAGHLRKARRLGALGEWTGYAGVEISTIHISIREQRPSPQRLPGTGDRERQGQGDRHAPLSAPTPQVWRSMCARELYVRARSRRRYRQHEVEAADAHRSALDAAESRFLEQRHDVSWIDMTMAVEMPKEA